MTPRAARTPVRTTRSLRNTPSKAAPLHDEQEEVSSPAKTPSKRTAAAATPKKTPVAARNSSRALTTTTTEDDAAPSAGKTQQIYVLRDASVLEDNDALVAASHKKMEHGKMEHDAEEAPIGGESLAVAKKHALDYADAAASSVDACNTPIKKPRVTRRKVPESFLPPSDEAAADIPPNLATESAMKTPTRSRNVRSSTRKVASAEDVARAIVDEETPSAAVSREESQEAATFDGDFDFFKRVKDAAHQEGEVSAAAQMPTVSLAEIAAEWQKALEDEETPVAAAEKSAKTEKESASLLLQPQQEPLVRNGVAATLALLYQRGVLQRIEGASNASYVSNDSFYAAKGAASSADYVPTFELRYTDEFGRELTPREAFKKLCHRFHGKAPGKQKMDKLLKKIAQEKALKQRAMGDAALDTSASLHRKLEATGSAYLVLAEK